jgi:hypothetical protein
VSDAAHGKLRWPKIDEVDGGAYRGARGGTAVRDLHAVREKR